MSRRVPSSRTRCDAALVVPISEQEHCRILACPGTVNRELAGGSDDSNRGQGRRVRPRIRTALARKVLNDKLFGIALFSRASTKQALEIPPVNLLRFMSSFTRLA